MNALSVIVDVTPLEQSAKMERFSAEIRCTLW
jgi:hypothetical protein